MLSKQIENAQGKVEEQNYLSRKRVLEYDDVMNEQRRVVYKYRREVLEGRDIGDVAREQVAGVASRKVDEYTASDVFEEWDLAGLETQLATIWPVSVDLSELDAQTSSREDVRELIVEDALAAYDEREEEFGEQLMRDLERYILLQIIDQRWKEHLHEMDYMREGIHLRGFAQIDPLVAYKNEGFIMFEALMDAIWEEYARLIFHVDVEIKPAEVEEAFAPGEEPTDVQLSGGTEAGQPSPLAAARAAAGSPAAAAAATGGAAAAVAAPPAGNGSGNGGTNPSTVIKADAEKTGRNDPCWCGSGKKFKKCHGS
jgi:preprotein translocase subunit SecA